MNVPFLPLLYVDISLNKMAGMVVKKYIRKNCIRFFGKEIICTTFFSRFFFKSGCFLQGYFFLGSPLAGLEGRAESFPQRKFCKKVLGIEEQGENSESTYYRVIDKCLLRTIE